VSHVRWFLYHHGRAVFFRTGRQCTVNSGYLRPTPDSVTIWFDPLLKLLFTLSYVLLAAFVGPFADSMAKGKVMLISTPSRSVVV
jgi:hypothetical protein